jgi:hypothetical protein
MEVNLKRYALVYVASAVGVALCGIVLDALTGLGGGSGISTLLPPAIAALYEGQKAADQPGPPFTSSQAWREARRMTLVVLAVSVIFLAVPMALNPELRAMVFSAPGVLGLFLAVAFAAVFLANRFALTWGFRNRRAVLAKTGDRS